MKLVEMSENEQWVVEKAEAPLLCEEGGGGGGGAGGGGAGGGGAARGGNICIMH